MRDTCVATLLAVVLVLTVDVHAKKIAIKIEVDKQVDFTQFKTYAWMERGAVARPLLAMEVVGAVDEELRSRGLTQTDHDPDLLVTFFGHIGSAISGAQSKDPTNTSTGGTAPGWGWSPPNSSLYVDKGTLIVDVVDARTKKLAWRGIARGNIDPEAHKQFQAVDDAVTKMFAHYPQKKR